MDLLEVQKNSKGRNSNKGNQIVLKKEKDSLTIVNLRKALACRDNHWLYLYKLWLWKYNCEKRSDILLGRDRSLTKRRHHILSVRKL